MQAKAGRKRNEDLLTILKKKKDLIFFQGKKKRKDAEAIFVFLYVENLILRRWIICLKHVTVVQEV